MNAMFKISGFCCFILAAGFGFLLYHYVAQGAGIQLFGPSLSSGSVLMGLVHVIGFLAGAGVCVAIGLSLLAHRREK